jgi:hypothetical protein
VRDCVAQDRDCHIAAIGPFLVEPHPAANATQIPATAPGAQASEPPR